MTRLERPPIRVFSWFVPKLGLLREWHPKQRIYGSIHFSARDPKNGKSEARIGKRRQWARQTPEKPIAALSNIVEFIFIILKTPNMLSNNNR